MTDLAPGTVFAGHRIQAVAGRGGMGVVYRATQLDLERTVALKLIAPAYAEDPDFRARFTRESRAAASIDHPNVLPIYYAGEHDGVLYLAMRHVEGEDLRALLRREGALEPGRAAQVISQVAAALDAAHARGIVHRDVKPANVLLDASEHVYLTDFGLTKLSGSTSDLSHAGQWVGTLGYVAPEQIRGERVDARTDVYALGCLLYFALTGQSPYRRDTDEATMWAHLNEPPPSARAAVAGLPERLDDVIARAAAKDPAERFPSGGDLGRAALAAAGRIVSAPPERRVATGAAAPPTEALTATSPGPSGETVTPPRGDEAPTELGARPRARRRRAWPLAVAPLLAAAAVAIVLAAGGGDDGPGAPPGAAVTTIEGAGTRPNDVAVGGGLVWALSGIDGVVRGFDARDESPAARLEVGSGASALAVGSGQLWVVKRATRGLLRYRLDGDHARVGDPIPLPAGIPLVVDTGAGAVWVGSRSGRGQGGVVPQTVTEVDPRSGAVVGTTDIPDGVQDLAVGDGAVWVANRRANAVGRIDPVTKAQRRCPVPGRPSAIAVGADAVWVTIADRDELVRIEPATCRRITIPVGADPRGVVATHGAVWVSNQTDSTVVRVDPRTNRRVGRPIDVGINPKAIALDGARLWVANVGSDSLSRVTP